MSMFDNPWTSLGLGLLAANTGGVGLMEGLGRGGLLAAQNIRLGEQHAAKMAQAKAEREAKEREQARQQAVQQYWQKQGGQIGALGQVDPAQAAQLQAQMMLAKHKAGLPQPVKPPAAYQNYMLGQQDPNFSAHMERMRKASAPKVVLPSQTQETAEAKGVGKFYAESFIDTQKAEREARLSNAKLARLDALFGEAYTGTGAKALLAARKAGAIIGMDFEGVGEAESAEALAKEMALELRSPAGGAGMPGAMSNEDRAFLQNMVPNLAITKEGRKLMIETRKKLNQRSIEVGKMAREYRKKHGSLDEGFYDVLAAFATENPMFGDAPKGGVNFMQETPNNVSPGDIDVVDWNDLPTSRQRGRNRAR